MTTNKGFTLIELIIIIALLGIVLTFIFVPVTFSFKNFENQNEKANLIANERILMDYLTREIRKANEVVIDEDENILILDSQEYKLKDGKLFKDEEMIMEGIENLYFTQKDGLETKEIEIEIEIKDSRGKLHQLSSIIVLR